MTEIFDIVHSLWLEETLFWKSDLPQSSVWRRTY